jgi:16S rRNA (adenine1518-N6/adenine1519-N6)-dimethyltransferase
VKAYGEVSYVKSVPRGHFNPPPKVDSAIVAVKSISRTNFTELDEKYFFELLHIGFGQRRKQLLGNLAKQFDRDELINIFSTLSLPLSTRAEDITLKEWLALSRMLAQTRNTQH